MFSRSAFAAASSSASASAAAALCLSTYACLFACRRNHGRKEHGKRETTRRVREEEEEVESVMRSTVGGVARLTAASTVS